MREKRIPMWTLLTVVPKPDNLIAMFDRWNKTNLVRSGYIWLPVTFENEKMVIDWKDSFSLR